MGRWPFPLRYVFFPVCFMFFLSLRLSGFRRHASAVPRVVELQLASSDSELIEVYPIEQVLVGDGSTAVDRHLQPSRVSCDQASFNRTCVFEHLY